MGRRVPLRFVKVEPTPWGMWSHFPDGTAWKALTHETGHYDYLAWRYGHQGNRLHYCWMHDVCHHLIGEAFGQASPTIWAWAHGEEPGPIITVAEESAVHHLHRLAFVNEPVLIEKIPWDELAARAREIHRVMGEIAAEG